MGNKITIRLAEISDIDAIITLEKKVWGEEGADKGKITSRIKTFPEGNIIALFNEKIVAYTSFQYVNNINNLDFSWSEITDNGKIANSHKPSGEYIYGVNLSVDPLIRNRGIGTSLILKGWANMIINNKKGSFLGARIPDYKKYKANHQEILPSDYIKLRRQDGKLYDSELRLYESEGLKVVKLLPNYFPDTDSLDYGVLVYRRNPFYNWPFKKFWAKIISNIAPKFIRSLIATKNFIKQ